jgi:hypothetical protein
VLIFSEIVAKLAQLNHGTQHTNLIHTVKNEESHLSSETDSTGSPKLVQKKTAHKNRGAQAFSLIGLFAVAQAVDCIWLLRDKGLPN